MSSVTPNPDLLRDHADVLRRKLSLMGTADLLDELAAMLDRGERGLFQESFNRRVAYRPGLFIPDEDAS